MKTDNLFGIIAAVVTDWNEHNSRKIAAVEDDGIITISPVQTQCSLPGPLVTDLAMLSEVYGFCWSIRANNGSPYISI